jgi:hypothetical protein
MLGLGKGPAPRAAAGAPPGRRRRVRARHINTTPALPPTAHHLCLNLDHLQPQTPTNSSPPPRLILGRTQPPKPPPRPTPQRYETNYFKPFPGYYFSGDGARRDKDGYFWITGRVDDVINVSGHRRARVLLCGCVCACVCVCVCVVRSCMFGGEGCLRFAAKSKQCGAGAGHMEQRPAQRTACVLYRLSRRVLAAPRALARRTASILPTHLPYSLQTAPPPTHPPQRIGTAEVESALVAHPKCAEAAVVGYDHPIKGQGIYAFVTLMEGEAYTEDLRRELVAGVRGHIGAFAAPDVVHWVRAPPRPRARALHWPGAAAARCRLFRWRQRRE